MLTDRDRKIVRFVEDFGIASTSQLFTLFFDGLHINNCHLRLRLLTQRGQLKRERAGIDKDYIYYIDKKPAQVEHHLLRADFYIKARDKLKLLEFIPEYEFKDARADAYFEFERGDIDIGCFLEIQLSAGFNQSKYEKYFASGEWHDFWTGFPPVIVATDRRIRLAPSEIKYIMLGMDFDFEKLLREI